MISLWKPPTRSLTCRLIKRLLEHDAVMPTTTSTLRWTSHQTAHAESVDTLIVGGGPIGASVAYHLATKRCGSFPQDNHHDTPPVPPPSILVVERDPSCNSGSAVFSAGGIRLQFSLKENVAMSLYGIDFFRQSSSLLATQQSTGGSEPVDIQYVENGYLFLASTESAAKQLRENHKLYTQLGCSDMIELVEPQELKTRFPWMNVDDVILGSHGVSGEGWFDPWTYVNGLNEKNKELGVQYMRGTVIGATRDPETGQVHSVQIQQRTGPTTNDEIRSVNVKTVVNAAGAAADVVLDRLAGNEEPLVHSLPVRPRKRCIYFFHCDVNQVDDSFEVPEMAPLTIDHSGAYFRSEGVRSGTGNFLCGVSPPKDQDRDCYDRQELDNADPDLFDDRIWPSLYNRVPAFGCLKIRSSWAGLYEYNTVDQNCILDFHPEMENVLMVNGFSGHGLQHSPAAGLAAAELIDNHNRFQTMDLDIFRFDRIIKNEPVYERGIY